MEKFQIQKYTVHTHAINKIFICQSLPSYTHLQCSLHQSHVAHADILHDKTPLNPFPAKAEIKY